MKVVILCGGLGTRLKEETEFRPKPMVNIGSRPILWHIMKTYAHYGYSEFVLPLGYKGHMIKDYFYHYELMNSDITLELGRRNSAELHNCHDETGWKITLANTGEKTLKGGRIKRIERYIDEDTFMLTYGDGVGDVNIPELLKFHHDHGKMITVTGIKLATRFGELNLEGNQVKSFTEKPEHSTSGLISGGFFVVNRRVFDYLTDDEGCDFEYGPLETIASEGELMVYKHDGYWACMDTLRDTEKLNRIWNGGRAPWKVW